MNRLNRLLEIPLNTDDISQELLNIEDRKRTSNFAWKGQFSPQFIEVMIDKYGSDKNKILDPFAGSGTVLYEALRKGIDVVGVELNPAAYYMSKFYELFCLNKSEQERIVSEIQHMVDNLLVPEDVNIFIDISSRTVGIKKSILNLVVILANVKKDELLTIDKVIDSWNLIKSNVDYLYENEHVKVYNRDFRNNKLNSNEFDLVLTSPPYINVFNYHENYRASVELLGIEVLKFAKSELGANRKNRGNRFQTVSQYIIDMGLIISEILRVSINDARVIFVVGRQSKVMGVEFYNSQLIVRIFEDIFGQKVFQRQERSFRNRFGQIIIEDILHINVDKTYFLEKDTIIEKARCIAYDELSSIDINDVPTKNLELFRQAIIKNKNILPSEIIGDPNND